MAYRNKYFEFSEQDLDTLSRTIYGETQGEYYKYGFAPLVAIANVVFNRKLKNFAKSIHEVCVAPHQFSCWDKDNPKFKIIADANDKCTVFRKCITVAENVLSGKWPDLTDGCDHYHARAMKPYWAIYQEPKRIFGTHWFYALGSEI